MANRGEIARRIFATANDMGIETVAVYSDGDADAPFVAEADQSVALGGAGAAESYLDQAKILDAARRSGADAVHPGYGFLSENASFAEAVIGAGLIWIGPAPAAIAAMGDKLQAKKLMADAGIPTLPSVEITDTTDLEVAAADIGYPVLVKAAAGGGGKGMRLVDDAAGLDEAVAGAQREAESSFGDGTVFLEKYLTAPRHVEIQVLGDQHGHLIHLFERECSIQRRHQKVIEEAPSPGIDEGVRQAMGHAALTAAQAIGYYSVGTVEFLVETGADGSQQFYFLEVNTRLQVEHPVTEEVTGIDLVRQQILVANGRPLQLDQAEVAIDGHAIEARLYAEDVAAGFLPTGGTLRAFRAADEPVVRLDSGVETGSVVGVDFDPMLAKVIAHGPTRSEAALRLALALERMTIVGVTTNRDFLVATLRSDEFLAGDTTTDFIDRFRPGIETLTDDRVATLLSALVLFRQSRNRSIASELGFMRSGYRNSVMPPETIGFELGGNEIEVSYQSRRGGEFEIRCSAGDAQFLASVVSQTEQGVDATIDGVRAQYTVINAANEWHVQGPTGRIDVIERSRFPDPGSEVVTGGQLAPMPGSIRVVAVEVGDQVEAGQTLVVIEAMKMEHSVTAPEASIVAELRCSVGEQVDNGAVLVVLEPLTD